MVVAIKSLRIAVAQNERLRAILWPIGLVIERTGVPNNLANRYLSHFPVRGY
jgi:hypothetical protein